MHIRERNRYNARRSRWQELTMSLGLGLLRNGICVKVRVFSGSPEWLGGAGRCGCTFLPLGPLCCSDFHEPEMNARNRRATGDTQKYKLV